MTNTIYSDLTIKEATKNGEVNKEKYAKILETLPSEIRGVIVKRIEEEIATKTHKERR